MAARTGLRLEDVIQSVRCLDSGSSTARELRPVCPESFSVYRRWSSLDLLIVVRSSYKILIVRHWAEMFFWSGRWGRKYHPPLRVTVLGFVGQELSYLE
eukprot:6434910-Amphidinium_carterae.1